MSSIRDYAKEISDYADRHNLMNEDAAFFQRLVREALRDEREQFGCEHCDCSCTNCGPYGAWKELQRQRENCSGCAVSRAGVGRCRIHEPVKPAATPTPAREAAEEGATHVSITVLDRISAQFQAYWDRHPEEKERAAANPVTEVEEYVNEVINTARWVPPVPAAGGDEEQKYGAQFGHYATDEEAAAVDDDDD